MRSIKHIIWVLGLLAVAAFGGTGAPFANQIVQGISDPRSYGNLSAWYDVSDLSSLRNNAGAVPSNGDTIKLIVDKSGNSAENCLVLNGVAGNYASAPDSAAVSVTGDLDLRAHVRLPDYTPAAEMMIIAKDESGQRSYTLSITSAGRIAVGFSSDGTSLSSITSSVSPTVSDGDAIWVRVTLDVDNGAGGKTATFYTSTDGSAWTQLGTQVTSAGAITIADTTSLVQIGANFLTSNRLTGSILRAQIYNGIAGTLAFDANFTTASKLATSFTESSSNAATVTINSTGDLGARICGARDLYQFTSTKQPTLTVSASGNYLTFDGSDDYMKAASFSLSQPETVYLVGSQVSWTSGDAFFDGNAPGQRGTVEQMTASPGLGVFAGTGPVALNNGLALNTRGVLAAIFNGAASSLRVNRTTPTTGSANTNPMNGFQIGANIIPGGFSNIAASEVIIRSAADATATQDAFILYMMRKWNIP